MSQDESLVKVRFLLPTDIDAWHKVEVERMWCEERGDGRYALRNSPFYVRGLSFGDVVEAGELDGALTCLRIVERSGHSTYRIFTNPHATEDQIQELLDKLSGLHCNLEKGTERLWAIDVRPEADIHKVHAVLIQAKSDDVAAFEEGHCGHSPMPGSTRIH